MKRVILIAFQNVKYCIILQSLISQKVKVNFFYFLVHLVNYFCINLTKVCFKILYLTIYTDEGNNIVT